MGRKSKEQLRKEYISRIRSEAGKKGGGWKLTNKGKTRREVCHKKEQVVLPPQLLS